MFPSEQIDVPMVRESIWCRVAGSLLDTVYSTNSNTIPQGTHTANQIPSLYGLERPVLDFILIFLP